MRRIGIICAGLAVLVFAAVILAQRLENRIAIVNPDLSGTWNLNKSKSKLNDRDVDRGMNRFLTIVQTKDEVSVRVKLQKGTSKDEANISGRFTLFPDGRGDKYLESRGSISSSVTKWKNEKLVVTHYLASGENTKRMSSTETFVLSDDGKTLTQTWVSYYPKTRDIEGNRALEKISTSILVFDRIK